MNVIQRKGNDLYPCPRCGFLMLEERGMHEICPVCFWAGRRAGRAPNHVILLTWTLTTGLDGLGRPWTERSRGARDTRSGRRLWTVLDGRVPTCKQKVRGSIPLVGSQLKGHFRSPEVAFLISVQQLRTTTGSGDPLRPRLFL
ncbi:CPCC family cysteine-rich protein [Streptosporangium nondiastaticum]|uniref:CPCC family cysteine-rich protein n=1 Tax=Streptosporangium nondiastaticum TaxID=35764 RepID=UPI0035EFF3E3